MPETSTHPIDGVTVPRFLYGTAWKEAQRMILQRKATRLVIGDRRMLRRHRW